MHLICFYARHVARRLERWRSLYGRYSSCWAVVSLAVLQHAPGDTPRPRRDERYSTNGSWNHLRGFIPRRRKCFSYPRRNQAVLFAATTMYKPCRTVMPVGTCTGLPSAATSRAGRTAGSAVGGLKAALATPDSRSPAGPPSSVAGPTLTTAQLASASTSITVETFFAGFQRRSRVRHMDKASRRRVTPKLIRLLRGGKPVQALTLIPANLPPVTGATSTIASH